MTLFGKKGLHLAMALVLGPCYAAVGADSPVEQAGGESFSEAESDSIGGILPVGLAFWKDDGCGADDWCGDPFEACCSACDYPPVFAGAEAVFLTPELRQDSNSISINGVSATPHNAEDFYATPRLWVGMGLGESDNFAQLRYWELDASENSSSGFSSVSNSSLEMRTFDFEVGRRMFRDDCHRDLQFTFGGRYADYDSTNGLGASVLDVPNGAFSNAIANSRTEFDGLGLTLSASGSRQFDSTEWRLFYSTRHSFVFGNVDSNAFSQASSSTLGAAAISTNGAGTGSQNATLYVGEFQLGTEWRRRLECAQAEAFVRFALEYQIWDSSSDNRAGSVSAAATVPGSTAAAAANSGPLACHLFGISAGAGFDW